MLRLLALEQLLVDCRCSPQQLVCEPQVVAALDAEAGCQQGWVPPGGVVPHPARGIGLATGDEGRVVGHRQVVSALTLPSEHALAGEPGEPDA